MSPDQPSISVVCPTYHSAAYVGNAVRSVLKQRVHPFEVIFSDDGSQDNTVDILRASRKDFERLGICFQLLRNAHAGPGATRNAAIKKARGDWIAFLDSDDQWTDDKIEKVVKAIKAHPEKNFFQHWEEYVRLDNSRSILRHGTDFDSQKPLPGQLYKSCFFSTSAVVCRKEIVDLVNGFDATFPISQDYELWLRMSPYIKAHIINECLGYYMESTTSITARPYYKRYYQLVRVLWRHRDKGGTALFLYRLSRATLSREWVRLLKKFLLGHKGH